MKYKVLFDPKAKQDLKEILIFVALNDNIKKANKLLTSLKNVCFKLEELPQRGHIPIELHSTGIRNYLEIHYKFFRIIYEVKKDLVYVHCVLDGRRNIQEILNERLIR